jgi:DnaJ-class molecular chaperone
MSEKAGPWVEIVRQCESCKGTGQANYPKPSHCRVCEGKGETRELVSLVEFGEMLKDALRRPAE